MSNEQLNEFIKIHKYFEDVCGRYYDDFFEDSKLYEIKEVDTLESIKVALPDYIDITIEVFDDFLEDEFGRSEDEYHYGILSTDGLDDDCEKADLFVENITKLISFLDAKDQEKYTKIFKEKIEHYNDLYCCHNKNREEQRLLDAIRDNDFDKVEEMLKSGVDHSYNHGWLTTPSGYSSSALEAAEELGYDDIAELLRKYGAED
jgi:hypothetical protein